MFQKRLPWIYFQQMTALHRITRRNLICVQVHRILHLVGLSLREEERRRQSESEPSDFEFTTRAEKFNILGLMEQLVGSQRIESHKHLLNWTIKKWQEVAGNKSK